VASISINTETVKTSAARLKKINKSIKSELKSVNSKVDGLNESWNSPASTKIINKYKKDIKAFSNARYNVMNDFINFLLEQVGLGYEQTEQDNKSLANLFK